MNEPFGRQPKPVKVTLEGEPTDTRYWAYQLAQRAEFKGDSVEHLTDKGFTIYPRAVND